jgi:hypothetical protein
MTSVSVPQQGQPIDVAYLSQLANAINTLSDQYAVSRVTGNQIWVGESSPAELSAPEIKFYTDQLDVGISGSATLGQTKEVTVRYSGFATVPLLMGSVISATPASVSFKGVSSSSATAVIFVDKAGDVGTMKLNILAIGKPA